MDVIELQLIRVDGSQDPNLARPLYQCGDCGALYNHRSDAGNCCTPYKCTDCGEELPLDKYPRNHFTQRMTCKPCEDKKHLARLVEELARAERIEVPSTRYVYHDDLPNEGYIDLDNYNQNGWTLLEIIEDITDQRPPCFVWDCDEESWSGIDIDSAIENALDDWYEDAADQLTHYKELCAYIQAWNSEQTLTQYRPNKRIIVLDAERFDAMLRGLA
ncbi:TPA: hypothetical protein LU109_003604 [Enterobacter hormaechei subsp. xiangfangensis]|nr:hypothetical protein [Enterobacter hormaechei subsp. xiangfangensis]